MARPTTPPAGIVPAGAVQRWLFGRDRYRPAGEVIRTAEYEVAPIADDTTARRFVLDHHYSGTYPAARFRFGLYRRGQLVGVAVYSHPASDKVLTNVFPHQPALASVELGRFVLLDEVPGNGETWFLAQTFRQLRAADIRGVVSFSDPTQRRSHAGIVVHAGHIGTIYQAANGRYTGRGTRRTLRLLPDGTVLSARAIQKIRKAERGHDYAIEQLHRAGATPLHPSDDVRQWLTSALATVTRTVQHPGNHRYAWPLHKHAVIALDPQPYPKH